MSALGMNLQTVFPQAYRVVAAFMQCVVTTGCWPVHLELRVVLGNKTEPTQMVSAWFCSSKNYQVFLRTLIGVLPNSVLKHFEK